MALPRRRDRSPLEAHPALERLVERSLASREHRRPLQARRPWAKLEGREIAQFQSKVGEDAHLAVDLLAKGRAVTATTDTAETPKLLPRRREQAPSRRDLALQLLARSLRR